MGVSGGEIHKSSYLVHLVGTADQSTPSKLLNDVATTIWFTRIVENISCAKVGTSRKEVEEILGWNGVATAGTMDLFYVDGLAEITFSFDDNDKIKSIICHMGHDGD